MMQLFYYSIINILFYDIYREGLLAVLKHFYLRIMPGIHYAVHHVEHYVNR